MWLPGIRNWTKTNQTSLRGRAYDPFAHAEELGLQVLFRPLTVDHERWLPQHATVVIKESLRPAHRRVACAHAIGHWMHRHPDNRPKHEVQADRYAAEMLVDRDEISDLIRTAPDLARIAAELGVTTRLLRVYLGAHRLPEPAAQIADASQQ